MTLTVEDIVAILPLVELAKLTNDTDGKDVNEAIFNELATRVVDVASVYLRGRYTLPLTTVEPALKDSLAKVFVYYAYRRRRGTVPTGVRDDYNDAISFLEKVQSGRIKLEGDTTIQPKTVAPILTNKGHTPKTMQRLLDQLP